MKDIDSFEIVSQILAFVGAQNPQGEADQRPQMHHRIVAAVVLTEFVDLGVTIVATGNAVIGTSGLDLLIFQATILQALFLESGLQEPTAAPAAEIVGAIGLHVDEILFAHHRFDDITQVFSDRVAVAFAHDLTRILNSKFDLQLFVPVGIDLKFAFPNPFGVVLVNILDLKVVLEVEFFQSGPD
jgi:hypothetical protein